MQKLLACPVELFHSYRVFVGQTGHVGACLVCLVGEYGGNPQFPFLRLSHHLLQREIVFLRHLHALHCKYGVEALRSHFLLLFLCVLPLFYHLFHVQQFRQLVAFVVLRLLVVVVQNIVRNKPYSCVRHYRLLFVYAAHFFVTHTFLLLHSPDVIHMEFQYVLVPYGVHYGVGVQRSCVLAFRVQFASKHLCRGLIVALAIFVGVLSEYRCACESKHHVFLKRLRHQLVHASKLRTVALVEYQHHVVLQQFHALVFFQHDGQLLYRGDYYPCRFVVQLSFQYCAVGVAVCAVLLEVVILLHGLIVQVLPVHHKQHFLHFLHSCRQLCCLERRESLSASCGVPDVASSLCSSLPSVFYCRVNS